MQGRSKSKTKFRPGFESFEARDLPSASPLAVAPAPASASGPSDPAVRLVVSRITNPTPTNAQLIPPFQQVRVQTVTPVTGGSYNILFVSVGVGITAAATIYVLP